MSGKKRIKIHANSSQEKIKEIDGVLEVWIKEKPVEGKANKKIEKVLTKYFKKPVKISSGFTSKIKYITIED